jgi:hypothetical protein
MPEFNIWNFLFFFTLFFALLVTCGPKTFALPAPFVARNSFAKKLMSYSLTQWIKNDPVSPLFEYCGHSISYTVLLFSQAKKLLEHCPSHTMDEDGPIPEMDEWHYAHRTCTSMLRGKIGDRAIIVKVWRGAHMKPSFKEDFVRVSPAQLFD